MSYKTREYEAIDDEGHKIHEELTAILDDHLPRETATMILQKIDALSSNHFEMEDYNQKRIYRALMGFIPEHAQEVRAALQPIVFDGSRCDEADWVKWEDSVEWPITPDFMKLLYGRRDDAS